MTKSRRRSTRRSAGLKLLEIAITALFALVMINLVIPWAVQSLSDSYARTIEQSR